MRSFRMIRISRGAPRRGERGASLVEYALLVALIAVVCIVSVTYLGTTGSGKINHAGSAINGEAACSEYQSPTGPYHRMTISPGVQGDPVSGACP